LLAARDAFAKDERSAAKLRRIVEKQIATAPLARVDYIEIVDDNTLTPIRRVNSPATIALAVFLGTTRLIDNLPLRFSPARNAARGFV
jgi:pantoate--beta-alanine ligase